MTVIVNDKRRVKVDETNVPEPGDRAERTFQATVGAIRNFLRAAGVYGKDGSIRPISLGMPQIEEIARHVVDAVITIDDGREWTAVTPEEMRPGDVFVWYATVAGVSTDMEVRVVNRKKVLVKQANTEGPAQYIYAIDIAHGNRRDVVKARVDHIFRIHRPPTDAASVRAALSDELDPL